MFILFKYFYIFQKLFYNVLMAYYCYYEIIQTQVINAAGIGSGNGSDVGQGSTLVNGDRSRRRYRRNGSGTQKSLPESRHKETNKNESMFYPEDRHNHHRQHQSIGSQHHQHNTHHSRRRRARDVPGGHYEPGKRWYRGWVDATIGGAGGGVPSGGTGNDWDNGNSDNFAGDDGYAGVSGVGDGANGAGYVTATLVRRGWETGDKELTPRAPVFAADGQGYVSVAPVCDDLDSENLNGDDGRGVRFRRPSAESSHFKNQWPQPRTSSVSSAGKYYAQVVSVNITKKLLMPLTFGESENEDGNNHENTNTKSWTVVRILAWNHKIDTM